jgi:hypothetical protein
MELINENLRKTLTTVPLRGSSLIVARTVRMPTRASPFGSAVILGAAMYAAAPPPHRSETIQVQATPSRMDTNYNGGGVMSRMKNQLRLGDSTSIVEVWRGAGSVGED